MNRKLFLSLAAAVLCSLSFFIFGGVRKTSAAGPAEIWIQIGDPNWVTKLESALLDPDCAEIVLGDGEFVFTETIKISLAAEAGVSKTLRSENSNTSVKAGVFANGFSYFLDITYPAEEFSLTVRGIDFEGNYTADDFPPQENAGGGISVAFGSAGGQNFAVENCSFRDFQKGDTSNFPNTPGDGAALKITTVYDTGRVSGNAAEISGCRFINNVTAYAEVYSGAAIAMISKPGLSDFPAGTCASLTVKDTQFINNGNLSGANINGGAVYAADCAVRIDRSEFTGNSTRGKGGAVYLQNCIDSYIADTTVYGNEGKTNNSGAAVYAYDSQMWLIGSTVTANTCVGNRSDNYKTAG
ncbi:MAG: hypothetical protein FWE62_03615, partial [Firmicutes bacterium]|nr:hypothetical protein [Bacillota bacterium]